MANINIGGRLHSVAVGNVVAGANEVYDDEKHKKQSDINADVDDALVALQQAIEQAGDVDDIQVNGTSIVSSKVANIQMQAMVDGNVGTPDVDVDVVGGVINLDFKNLKGEPAEMAIGSTTTGEPGTSASVTNSGTGNQPILDFVIPKGEKGEQGDSAVFDPETGNILATLHNTTGDDDANGMTQKAVTDALVAKLDTDTNAKSDLDMVDERGNIIARFANGHVKTKNFDSSKSSNLKVIGNKLVMS